MDKKVTIYPEFFEDIESLLCDAYAKAIKDKELWTGYECLSEYEYAIETLKACQRMRDWLEGFSNGK